MHIDKRKLSPELEAKIANVFFLARLGRTLREMWKASLREDLPPRIAALVRELQAREQVPAKKLGGTNARRRRGSGGEPVATRSSPPEAPRVATAWGSDAGRAGRGAVQKG